MEKHIVLWSYWLGLLSAVIALVFRAVNALGMFQGQTARYMTFYKGALLFFVIAIATANYAWVRVQKPQ